VAVNSPAGARNLGYSASATLDIPVWDWFATHDRVKQSEVRRQVAQVQLSYTQKRLMASLEELYNEVVVSYEQLGSLDQSIQDARDSLRLTIMRYKAGEATALEVVAAQDQLVQVETARANGVIRYRVALANLQTLTGVL
jgi:outer membrane protein TolC